MIFPSLVLSSQDMFLLHTLPTQHTQFSIFNGDLTGVFLLGFTVVTFTWPHCIMNKLNFCLISKGLYGSSLVGEEKIQ